MRPAATDPAALLRPVQKVATFNGDWRSGLPTLTGRSVQLREVHTSDAYSLFTLLTAEEVARFISPPGPNVESFEQFIGWMQHQRRAGAYACFAVTRKGCDTAAGIFQVHVLDAATGTAEWGFALGRPFWGTGVFAEGAELVLSFIFTALGVRRLEARAALDNRRANRALAKLGAVQERVLTKAFERRGAFLDQVVWVIQDDAWTSLTP